MGPVKLSASVRAKMQVNGMIVPVSSRESEERICKPCYKWVMKRPDVSSSSWSPFTPPSSQSPDLKTPATPVLEDSAPLVFKTVFRQHRTYLKRQIRKLLAGSVEGIVSDNAKLLQHTAVKIVEEHVKLLADGESVLSLADGSELLR